jgi:anhydro-N-acetylmuramic acid kinase
MSGTSLDGIDCVLASIDESGKTSLIQHRGTVYPVNLKEHFKTLQSASPNELHLEATCANLLAIEYARLIKETLDQAGLQAYQINAIGAHGQTIRHQPLQSPQDSYTLQSLNAALLAELTGIHVISDFRSRDLAASGQGAPLVPGFHAAQFFTTKPIAVLNLGGIGNLTIIHSQQEILGFDTGPANVLLNEWISKILV